MASPIKITITDASSELGGKVPLTLVRFDGQLDESNVDDQATKLYGLVDAMVEGTFFIFDLEGLTYMNSKSIGYLTDWHLKVSSKKGEILLARARENILDILNVVGLTQIVRTFATLDEAKLAILQQLEGR
jgi:anti-anti-sigma factor